MFKNNKSEVIKIVNIPLVSSDIIGSTEGALVDGLLTKVVEKENGSLIKVSAWYDNEWGYTAQMLRVAEYWCKNVKKHRRSVLFVCIFVFRCEINPKKVQNRCKNAYKNTKLGVKLHVKTLNHVQNIDFSQKIR